MGRVVDESLRVMGGVRGLRVVDTAAALTSCGGSDEWCSAAIADKVRLCNPNEEYMHSQTIAEKRGRTPSFPFVKTSKNQTKSNQS